MHILHVVGARPNFMKAAPVLRALGNAGGFKQTLVHTGQHYDTNSAALGWSPRRKDRGDSRQYPL